MHSIHFVYSQEFTPDTVAKLPPDTPADSVRLVVDPVDDSQSTSIAVDVFACFEEGSYINFNWSPFSIALALLKLSLYFIPSFHTYGAHCQLIVNDRQTSY